jgi:replicative DNA helicase
MRLPPSDIAAEEALLGACVCSPASAVPAANDIITGGDFYRDSNGSIFNEIVSMWMEDSSSVDAITVGTRFPEQKEYIFTIAECCPSIANTKHYANIIKRASIARSLIRAGNEIAELGYDEEAEPAKLLDGAESKLSGLRPSATAHTHRLGAIGRAVIEAIESGERPPMVSSGIRSLDQYIGGLHDGNFIVVGARPGVGKTVLGLTIAEKVAHEGTVMFFSLEMSASELTERLQASIACVSLTKMRERRLTPDELAAIYKAQAELEEGDLILIDNPSITIMSLKSAVRQQAKRTNLKLVVVDYLQLMSLGQKSENRREEVSMMSRQLKSLAREVGVPIIALSQLNRMSTFDGTKVDISQLKESGSLEQDADLVWLLSWPKQQEMGTNTITLDVAKNRHGPLGAVDLVWVPQYARIEE